MESASFGKQGAVRIDEERISDERAMIRPQGAWSYAPAKRGFAKIVIG